MAWWRHGYNVRITIKKTIYYYDCGHCDTKWAEYSIQCRANFLHSVVFSRLDVSNASDRHIRVSANSTPLGRIRQGFNYFIKTGFSLISIAVYVQIFNYGNTSDTPSPGKLPSSSLHISFKLSPVHSFALSNHCLVGLPRVLFLLTLPTNMVFAMFLSLSPHVQTIGASSS